MGHHFKDKVFDERSGIRDQNNRVSSFRSLCMGSDRRCSSPCTHVDGIVPSIPMLSSYADLK